MVCPEAAASRDHERPRVFIADKGQNLFHNIMLVPDVIGYLFGRGDVMVVKALQIVTIYAKHLDLSVSDLRLESVDDLPVFIIIKPPHPRWKK
jgi:hypothetical protein